MVNIIKFANHRDNFLEKIKNDPPKIHHSNKIVFFFADKTTNLYSTIFPNYKKLTTNNVMQIHKKAPEITMKDINKETKEIATKSNIDHKMNSIAEQPAFIIIKKHKPDFTTNPTYRFIKPSKFEIGKISKHILVNINTQPTNKLQLNQWKNTKLSPTGSQLYPTRTTQPSISQTSNPPSPNTHLIEP